MRRTDVWKIGKKTIAAIVVFAMVFSVFVGIALNGKAEVFGTDVQVSDADGGYQPAIALSSTGTIYVAFEDDMTGLDFSKSIDNGATFSTQISVSSEYFTTARVAPVAAYGENNVYIAWQATDNKIYYAMSDDGGDTFGEKVQVSTADADVSSGHNVGIAVDSDGGIFVVWDGDDYIYIDYSASGSGADFGTDIQVNPTQGGGNNPSIAISSDILVVWDYSSHVYFAKATPPGAFSTPVQVDDSTSVATYPSIGVDADGKIFVAWQDSRDVYADIYAAVSSDGTSFSAGVKVNDDTTDTDQKLPSLAVHPCGKVFVAWQDERSGNKEIYFANSTDGGVSFGTNVKVSDAAPATSPSLAVGDDTEVYIVWTGSSVCGTIYFDWADDATWPNAVADLEVVDATTDSLTINWTAPGDNFALGTATTYDIRYSTSTITDANWAAATPVTANPSPSAGGNAETFQVTGLNNDTTYYFALKTSDEIPNTSPLSNVASGKTLDDWAPDAVIDLDVSAVTSNTITLTWTAPGDNGNIGTATTYDIRYSESEINDTNWAEATNCTGEPTPSVATTTETFEVTGLSSGTPYYFALMTADEVPNPSLLSNVVTETTLTNQMPNAPTLTAPANDTWITTGVPTFTWTFSDPDVADTQGGYLWQADNNSDFASPDYTNETTSSVSSYTPATAIADGVWYWRVKTKDNHDGWGEYSEYWVLKIDTAEPTGSIVINDNAAKITTTSVTLTLTYSDLGSGVYKVRYSNDGVWDTEEWADAAATKDWTLTTGDGLKTVYYQIKDNAGKIAEYNDTITLDTTAASIINETTTGSTITAEHTGTGDIVAASASSPGAAPSGKKGIGKFVEITKSATLNINWVYITIPYTETDLPSGVDESSLKIYYWTGTEWAVCDNTGVDTANKVVYANVTHLTIFAPMAESAAVTPTTPVNWALYGGVVAVIAIVIIAAAAVVVTKKKKGKGETPVETEE